MLRKAEDKEEDDCLAIITVHFDISLSVWCVDQWPLKVILHDSHVRISSCEVVLESRVLLAQFSPLGCCPCVKKQGPCIRVCVCIQLQDRPFS